MPTHEELAPFLGDWRRLSAEQQVLFMAAVTEMAEDLADRGRFRATLRINRLQDHQGIFEMSWSRGGRATFQYRAESQPGEAHIIWRRVGGSEILTDP